MCFDGQDMVDDKARAVGRGCAAALAPIGYFESLIPRRPPGAAVIKGPAFIGLGRPCGFCPRKFAGNDLVNSHSG